VLGDLGINLATMLGEAGLVGVGSDSARRTSCATTCRDLQARRGPASGRDVITVGNATGAVREAYTLRITRVRDGNGRRGHIANGRESETVGTRVAAPEARAVIDFPVPFEGGPDADQRTS